MTNLSVEIIKSLLTGGSLTFGISIYHVILFLFVVYKVVNSYMKYEAEYPKNWRLRSYISKYSPYMPMVLNITYSDKFANNPDAYNLIRSAVKEAIIKGLNKYDDKFVGKRYGFSIPENIKPFKVRLVKTTNLSKKDRDLIKKMVKDMSKNKK